jgi:hypothetical protein
MAARALRCLAGYVMLDGAGYLRIPEVTRDRAEHKNMKREALELLSACRDGGVP